jgi:hypothetical protein
VAAHTWWRAERSKKNPRTPWQSLPEYFRHYAHIIVLRTLFGVVIFGVWMRNPDALAKLAYLAKDAGWNVVAGAMEHLAVSPHDIFVALGFGLLLDLILYLLARYIPGFKKVLPDAPGATVCLDVEEAKKLRDGGAND